MEPTDHPEHAPIIAAFSPQTGAREPVEFGLAASRITGAPLVIVAVADTGSLPVHFGADDAPALPGSIDEALRHLKQSLAEEGHQVEVKAFGDSTPARGLARAMEELAPGLVVVGSTNRGRRGAALLGTTAERVIHTSTCPVAVVPNGYTRSERDTIVVGAAYTDTPEGEEALRAAATLARADKARLRAIVVLDPKHAAEQERGLLAEQHHDVSFESSAAARVRAGTEAHVTELLGRVAGGIDADIDVLVNQPAAGLIAASSHVDLLVMGSRGLGARRSVILGSVSRKVIDNSACPVVVIPRGASGSAEELLADVAGQSPPRP